MVAVDLLVRLFGFLSLLHTHSIMYSTTSTILTSSLLTKTVDYNQDKVLPAQLNSSFAMGVPQHKKLPTAAVNKQSKNAALEKDPHQNLNGEHNAPCAQQTNTELINALSLPPVRPLQQAPPVVHYENEPPTLLLRRNNNNNSNNNTADGNPTHSRTVSSTGIVRRSERKTPATAKTYTLGHLKKKKAPLRSKSLDQPVDHGTGGGTRTRSLPLRSKSCDDSSSSTAAAHEQSLPAATTVSRRGGKRPTKFEEQARRLARTPSQDADGILVVAQKVEETTGNSISSVKSSGLFGKKEKKTPTRSKSYTLGHPRKKSFFKPKAGDESSQT